MKTQHKSLFALKKLIPLFVLLFAVTAKAQIVNIPDANFKAKLLLASPTVEIAKGINDQWIKIDANNDGEIQQSEADLVKYLDISNSNIRYSNGLISFVNLEVLRCRQNKFTSITLNGLVNLKEIDLWFNYYLKTLNLSGLSNLKTLSCYSCNNLQTLNMTGLTNLESLNYSFTKINIPNFSGLTNLKFLGCAGSELSNLNLTGLPNLTTLYCFNNSISLLDLSGLPNLEILGCGFNLLTTIDTSSNPNLKTLNCNNNLLTTLNVNQLLNLETLDCGQNQFTNLNLNGLTNLKSFSYNNSQAQSVIISGLTNLEILNLFNSQLTSLDVNNLPNLKKLNCGKNDLTSLTISNLLNLDTLNCAYNLQLTNLSLSNLPNLKSLSCNGGVNGSGTTGTLTTLNVNGLTSLEFLDCQFNQLTTLNLNGLTNLKNLVYNNNLISSLTLNNLPNLVALDCSSNQITNLDVSNLTSLKSIACGGNLLTSLNLNNLPNLTNLNCNSNQLTQASITGVLTNLTDFNCNSNQLTSLDLTGFNNLKNLDCYNNNLTTLNLTGLSNLNYVQCSNNNLSALNLSGLNSLGALVCNSNQLTSLNLTGLNKLVSLYCSNNQITNLNLNDLTNLISLDCSLNQISNLNVSNNIFLDSILCNNNQLSSLNLFNSKFLYRLNASNNLLTTLDLGTLGYLGEMLVNNNQLTTLFAKNGSNETMILDNNPNLTYICADTSQVATIQGQLNGLSFTNTVCNSYCSFTPGGNFNTITGTAIFDGNNNGCDVLDGVKPFVRFDINDGVESGATVTNINGIYSYFTNEGDFTIAPNVENQSWFNFSPPTVAIPFVDNNNNNANQDFCITANGVHNDVEVVVAPITPARPGFDAEYNIVFKNKGNQTLSGNINFTYNDNVLDYVSATAVPNSQSTGVANWSYANLLPFESRNIQITLNVNSPTEIPAVNNGDLLIFSTSITPIITDDLPSDNSFTYYQRVVGSYDPNDITCLEGETVAPSEIGNYLHYVTRFENLGTFYAENVVVRIEIDATKYDINSLQVLNSTYPSSTRITGNTVEFIMQNINLTAASGTPPVGGHGDVLFKIRTKADLVSNDTVLQRAGIYFDYNSPVNTNNAETTFATLNNPIHEFDYSVKVYPNPAHTTINISCNSTIQSVALYDIQGRLLETDLANNNEVSFDISGKSNGVYFIKITSDKGSKVEKIVKE
ncbi:T9SS type A sorting domain-containing protein [Flavobacterium sp.]|uniref:T9SS type A sorting domain-containing protein n=1 Tax=Flavobacterium sp. TaxID=239 RepID=UPI0025EEE5BB|nr:T9SS type A sorting domain-containing protein [Flavobacterium sp.]